MDWGECVCMVAEASVGDFNNVILFYLVIEMSHMPSPEPLLLPCRIKVHYYNHQQKQQQPYKHTRPNP